MNKITIDHAICRVYLGGIDLELTTGEYRIVAKLATKPGSWFSYRELYDTLKGIPGFHAGDGERGVNSNVRSAIKRIRRKFEKLDPAFDGIENYQAFGYGLKNGAVPSPRCCPTCGQIVIRLTETVVPVTMPPPIVQPTPDYQQEVVTTPNP